jgi:tRNA threonylcarbamoyladenosine biosynthesis protein TsaB
MLILTIRSEKPEAEIGLYKDKIKLDYIVWHADRRLAETLHQKLRELLEAHKQTFANIEGIVVYKGPGSFTGLRIGISVANALADGLAAPIVGTNGSDWIEQGMQLLGKGENEHIVLPEYGALPHITQPKK